MNRGFVLAAIVALAAFCATPLMAQGVMGKKAADKKEAKDKKEKKAGGESVVYNLTIEGMT